jgi:protein-disulfide isomerase
MGWSVNIMPKEPSMKYVLTLLAALAFCAPAQAADTLTKSDVEKIVKETIANNPELIMESLKKNQEKQRADADKKSKAALKDRAKEILADKNAPIAGNPKGDVTVVEFFDYHCGYCKKMLPTVTDLIKSDKKVRVMFREFPILSPDSEMAARAALAVFHLKPESYFDFHTALMNISGKYDEAMLIDEAKKLGIDEDKLKKEMESKWVDEELKKSRDLADALAIRGTPAFIVGDQLIPGAASLEDLKKAVAAARK